ncbi:hypothetical protein [Thiohalocapsa sp. ML1]|uniref:hypothetical protein n=1 Tax=Thiohalocapsa sp. ML1 TaxID=1431688 RepID=UPI000ADE76C9|nr:hypothetical protein [Thiohalocapsa sp. ML1]
MPKPRGCRIPGANSSPSRPTASSTCWKRTPLLERLRLALKAKRTDRSHQLWQEGSHPQCIQGEEMLRQKLEYIHNNPVKRGFVDEPEHWRWSSARNYAGREGMIEVFTGW